MNFVEGDNRELISLLEKEYEGNQVQIAIIQDFQCTYSSERAVWWYTRESCFYRILNKALRTQNIDLLFLLRPFIFDIRRQLLRSQSKSPMHVYRSQ